MAHEESATPMALIYCPCPSLEEARRLGGALLDARLAGCVNILPGMISLYDWDGARQESAEVVLIAKTSAERAGDAAGFLAREHPYEVPAILTLPLSQVNGPFREWLLQGIS